MTTLPQMFSEFRDYAWRLEGRDTYLVAGEEERVDTFRRGQPLPRKTRENNTWIATVEDIRSRGASIGRVRLVGHPITLYTRFEFAAYPDNIAAGEDVRAIDRAALDAAWDNMPDFWLFDDKIAFVQHYDHEGRFLGARVAEDVDPFIEIRHLLNPHAEPIDTFDLSDLPRQRTHRIGPPPELEVASIRRTERLRSTA